MNVMFYKMCPARLDREEEYFVRKHFLDSREKSLDELCGYFYPAACSFLEQDGNVTRALGRIIRGG